MKVSSAIFDSFSGKLAGAVAAKARGGISYLRARVNPSQPRTAAQSGIRAILTGLASAWGATLTHSRRAAWTALAGPTESGIDVYVGSNAILMQGGHARVDDAPPSRSLPWTTIPDPTADGVYWKNDSGTITIAFANGYKALLPNGDKINVYAASSSQRDSRLAQQFPFRHVGTLTMDGTTNPPNLDVSAFVDNYPNLDDNAQPTYIRLVGWKATGEVTQEIAARIPNHNVGGGG